MMRNFVLLLLLVFVGMVCVQCSTSVKPENNNSDPDPIDPVVGSENPGWNPQYPDPGINRTTSELTGGEKKLAQANNSFGLKLFKNINSSLPDDTNIFISPISVSYALGMAYNGANGATKDAIASTLELADISPIEVNTSYKNLTQILINLDEYVTFNIANSIWYRQGFPVYQQFLDINHKYFLAETRGIDFNQIWAADTINYWVDVNTNGKIKEVIKPPIDPLTMMYAINAIYFKGGWVLPFDTANTKNMNFTRMDESHVSRPFMPADTNFFYFDNDLFQAIDLFYGDSAFSMTVLLPQTGHTVDDIIDELNTDNWNNWMSQFVDTMVHLSIPKFKFEFDMKLVDVLSSMGMGVAFSPLEADFSLIADVSLYISGVLHKTFVQVDEEGTEAAAVTVVGFGVTSIDPTPYMTIDHPFLFVIREHASGAIIFIGKVTDPVWDD